MSYTTKITVTCDKYENEGYAETAKDYSWVSEASAFEKFDSFDGEFADLLIELLPKTQIRMVSPQKWEGRHIQDNGEYSAWQQIEYFAEEASDSPSDDIERASYCGIIITVESEPIGLSSEEILEKLQYFFDDNPDAFKRFEFFLEKRGMSIEEYGLKSTKKHYY